MVPGYAFAAPLGITFERNDGQLAREVLFAARGVAGDVSVGRGELSLLAARRKRTINDFGAPVVPAKALRIGLVGADLAARIEAQDPRATRSHYYLGSDRRRYRENVPHFGQVLMREVYPGIDLAVHGTQGALEYDFIVAPQGDPAAIRLDLSSAERVWVDARGDLQMRVGGEQLTQRAPVAFQDIDGERVRVPARFELALASGGMQAKFTVGAYDRSKPLVIDPVIAFSTYLGGSQRDSVGYMARDAQGHLHIAYASTTPMAPEGSVSVTRIDPVTRQVVYTTTFGGGGVDYPRAIAVRAGGGGGQTIVAGVTFSNDFPRCVAVTDCVNARGLGDAFVTALDAGGQLRYSRLLGGVGSDEATAVAVDAAGNIYLAGSTASGDFPTTPGSLYPMRRGLQDDSDAFVTKFDIDGNIAYSTYLGGSGSDQGTGIAVDDAGNIHVAGYTRSGADFPIVPGTSSAIRAPFIAKINPAGTAFLYSRHLGSSGDWVEAIAVDPATQGLVVAGETGPGYYSGLINGYRPREDRDVWVARLSANATSMSDLKFLGGSGAETLGGIAVAANGDIYVTGTSFVPAVFPKVDALPGTVGAARSAFVARIRQGQVDFSSTLGGGVADEGDAIVVDALGAYVLGTTASPDFPLALPIQATLQGESDLFLARVALVDAASDTDGDGVPAGVEFQEGLNPLIRDNDVFNRDRLFVMQQYRDFLGREGDAGGIAFYEAHLAGGSMTRTQVIEAFLGSAEFQNGLPQCTRLYFSFFNRIPDYGGLMFQVGQFRSSVPLDVISQNFSNSPEFTTRYGALTNEQYVDLVYQNVLGRAPDPGGRQFYLERLADGRLTRGQMMIGFSESPEFQQLVVDEVYVTAVYVGMLHRAPDPGGMDFYVNQIAGGSPRNSIINGFMGSPEYHGRFLP